MDNLLSISGVSVAFDGLTAIDDLSIDVRKGEILGVIGPNGAGKSTLFNAVCGLIRLSGGSVHLGVHDITPLTPGDRMGLGIQRTFQSVQLVKSMTVLENILLGLHRRLSFVGSWLLSCSDSAKAEDHARDIAGLVGVSNVADTVVDTLSYREQRLTEIGRAIASRPSLLLLDEPAAGLSAKEIRALDDLIKSLRQELGITVLLVEHVMPLVMGVCDRVAVLESGSLLTIGLPAEVAANEHVIKAYLGESGA